MKQALQDYRKQLEEIRASGTYKEERIITTPQRSRINTTAADRVVNMCANNYLGLSDSPELIEAARKSYEDWGFGLSSVRFICGTQQIHKDHCRLCGHRGRYPLFLLLRRQRRPL